MKADWNIGIRVKVKKETLNEDSIKHSVWVYFALELCPILLYYYYFFLKLIKPSETEPHNTFKQINRQSGEPELTIDLGFEGTHFLERSHFVVHK